MKILFLLHTPPPVHGSSVVGKTIKESRLINESFECQFINLLVSRKIEETGKNNFIKFFRFIIVWFKLLFALLKNKPDICYLALTTNGIAFFKDVFFIFLLKLFKVKQIFHLHHKGVKKNEETKIYRFFYRFVFEGSDVILLSRYLYSDVKKFVQESQVHICPNGTENISTQYSKRLILGKKVNFLFLSNLIISKGIYYLLDACVLLKNRGLDFECQFVGGEGDIAAYEFNEIIKKKELTNIVYYLGKKNGKQKDLAYENADIFVQPTFNDCFPLVLLEAMQFSLPVVSTYEGGIPDIVEDGITGFLVPQKDVHALADKLEILMRNSELRKEMGIAGRKKYEEEFTLEKFENRLVKILKEVSENSI